MDVPTFILSYDAFRRRPTHCNYRVACKCNKHGIFPNKLNYLIVRISKERNSRNDQGHHGIVLTWIQLLGIISITSFFFSWVFFQCSILHKTYTCKRVAELPECAVEPKPWHSNKWIEAVTAIMREFLVHPTSKIYIDWPGYRQTLYLEIYLVIPYIEISSSNW